MNENSYKSKNTIYYRSRAGIAQSIGVVSQRDSRQHVRSQFQALSLPVRDTKGTVTVTRGREPLSYLCLKGGTVPFVHSLI